jgi:hypothetical protein
MKLDTVSCCAPFFDWNKLGDEVHDETDAELD